MANGVTDIAANDRYVLTVENPNQATVVQLLDERTGRRQPLSPPDCPTPAYYTPVFGDPWVILPCGKSYELYELYNLHTGQWVSFTPFQQCAYVTGEGPGQCLAVGIGRNWVKLATAGGCSAHCAGFYYLQHIFTGEVKPDPITPHGTTFDDLGSPSGSRPLCSPLRYPANDDNSLGTLTFYGRIGLAYRIPVPYQAHGLDFYHLQRCGTRLNLSIDADRYWPAGSPAPYNPPVASSRAVVWTRQGDGALVGRLFPSLQRFTIRLPAALKFHPGQTNYEVTPAALTRRTIYLENHSNNQLWAAALPPPRRRRG